MKSKLLDGCRISIITMIIPAIQENLNSIMWDEPQQALLSLAAIVENSMGGSSGAVSLWQVHVSSLHLSSL